jgi:hypothetical protein
MPTWDELETGDIVLDGVVRWTITRKQDGWYRLECDGQVRDGKPDPNAPVIARVATYGHPERMGGHPRGH